MTANLLRAPVPVSIIALTSDVTVTSTTAALLTGLSWSLPDVGTYLLELYGLTQSSVTTQGPRFGVNGTGITATAVCQVEQYTSATAVTAAVLALNAYGGATPGTAATSFLLRMKAIVTVTASTSGTIQVWWNMSGASGTGTLKAGSYAQLRRVT